MRISLYICAALLAVSACPSYASNYPLHCQDADTPQELSACVGKHLAASDKRLNTAYQRLLSVTADYNHDLFVNAQRAWRVWRDKEAEACAAAGGYTRPGSGFPAEYGLCTVDLNNDRVKALQQYRTDLLRRQ